MRVSKLLFAYILVIAFGYFLFIHLFGVEKEYPRVHWKGDTPFLDDSVRLDLPDSIHTDPDNPSIYILWEDGESYVIEHKQIIPKPDTYERR